MGARPGSLDREKRTLTGQRGRINNNTGAQAGKSSVNPRPCWEAGRYLAQKKAFSKGGNGLNVPAGVRPRPADVLGGSQFFGKAFYKGGPAGVRPRPVGALEGSRLRGNAFYKGGPASVRPRPADALEGSRFCGKGSSSPDPKSGEQWTPFGKVSLLPGGERIQGARKPSAVSSADACLSVCLSSALRVCVCRHCLWSSSSSFFQPGFLSSF